MSTGTKPEQPRPRWYDTLFNHALSIELSSPVHVRHLRIFIRALTIWGFGDTAGAATPTESEDAEARRLVARMNRIQRRPEPGKEG